MDTLSGAVELLAGAISYMLAVCAPIGAAELTLPTPCPDWNLAMLLGHLCQSMADLETALRTGRLDLDLEEPAGRYPVENAVIKGFQPDPDILTLHLIVPSTPLLRLFRANGRLIL